jgi:CubicO group peptidase (beta-lactamase class C family)
MKINVMPNKFSVISLALAAPLFAIAAPDESELGKEQNYPVGNIRNWTQPQFRVGSWSAPQKIEGLSNSVVEKSATPYSLKSSVNSAPLRYSHNGKEYSIDEYLDRQRTTSLFIVKDGTALFEKYQYGSGKGSRFFSYSMAKSLTALLVGVAIDKGLISSLDDPAEKYSQTLKGTAYGSTSIRNLLRMSSGIDFTENYSSSDDLSKLSRSAFTDNPPIPQLFKNFQRKSNQGERFNYSSLETMAIGYLLKDVSGKSIVALTKDWVWDPMGAEDEGYWILSKSGMEGVYCCFAASSRDWAKLGMIFANKGKIENKSIVSAQYISEATSIDLLTETQIRALPEKFGGYGYQVWLLSGPGNQFVFRGTYGQSIFVHGDSGTVMVHTAAFKNPTSRTDPEPYNEMLSLWGGVLKSLGSAK